MIAALLFCVSKRAFHVDESLSFALANHPTGWVTYDPQGWFDKTFFSNYGVTDAPFNYGRVYNNQLWDVHPPLYYDVLHTICSFFPYRFTAWFGLVINIGCFLVTLILIYATIYKLTKNDLLGSLSVLVYGLNKYILDDVIFIRMYAMSAMWILFFVYLAIKIIEEDKKHYWNYILLLASTICGGLTHYHFYFIAGSMCLIIGIYLILTKQWQKLICSFVSVLVGGLLNLYLFFPATFRHLSSAHAVNAENAMQNLSINFSSVDWYIKNSGGYILFVMGSVLLFATIGKKILNKQSKDSLSTIAIIMLISYYLSFVLITKTTYIQSSRYIVPLMSLQIIGTMLSIYGFMHELKMRNILVLIASILIIAINFDFRQVVNNINTLPSWEYAKEHQYGVAVVIIDEGTQDYEINELFTDLRWYFATGITHIGQEFDNDINDDFVLYIQKDLNQEEAIAYLQSQIRNGDSFEFELENINKYLFNVYTAKGGQ